MASVQESGGDFPTTFANTWNTSYLPNPKSQQIIYRAGAASSAIATGLRGIDMDKGYQLRLNSSLEDIRNDSFKATITTWGDSKLYDAGMSWLCVPRNNDFRLQAGRFDATDTNTTIKISFSPPYQKPPSVVVWLTGFHLGHLNNWRLKAEAKDITSLGFSLVVDSWSDTHVHTASACWIAHPADHPRVTSGSYSTDMVRPWNKPTAQTYGTAKFSRPFLRPPHVVSALSSFDVDFHQNFRFKMPLLDVTSTEIHWALDTWHDSTLYSASAWYIAFGDVSLRRTATFLKRPLNHCDLMPAGLANFDCSGSTSASVNRIEPGSASSEWNETSSASVDCTETSTASIDCTETRSSSFGNPRSCWLGHFRDAQFSWRYHCSNLGPRGDQ